METATRDAKPYCNPKVPRREVDIMLGRVHVSTSPEEVERQIREQITIAMEAFGSGEEWTPSVQEQTVRYALWRHRANLRAYREVMG